MKNLTRRRFMIQTSRVLAFIPIAGVVGCVSGSKEQLGPKGALKRLILLVGPWSLEDLSMAEDFAERFLASDHASPYLAKSVDLVQSISRQISKEEMSVREIDLGKIPGEEKESLLALTKQLYSLTEVRFYVSNEPPWGQCQGDPMWHTRRPV